MFNEKVISLKKVLFILIGILCAVSAGAVKYGTLYRDPRRGFIYTISSSHNSAASAGLAPAPVATMGSVSRGAGLSRSRGVSSTMGSISVAMPVAVAPMSGIRTAAATVSGGVTTYEAENENSYSPTASYKSRGIRKSTDWHGKPEGLPDCGCNWVQIDEERWQCTECGAVWNEFNNLIETPCACGTGTCNCSVPLDLNWGAMVFLMLLAVGYGVRASMREKCTMKENENRA